MKFTNYAKTELKRAWITAFIFVVAGFLLAFFWEPSVGFTLSAITLIVWLAFILFFRDPERDIPQSPDIFVSPADGLVRDIELITNSKENEFFDGDNCLRIGIFLSVFDVHINRAPFDMEVVEILHREGKYHDARSPHAVDENEAVTMRGRIIAGDDSYPIVVRQISGAIAKRIVCDVKPGDQLFKGQRYGMIKFGSRTEVYFPAKSIFELTVKVGDRVSAGSSPIISYQNKAN